MATALVLMQENETRCEAVKTLREKINSIVEDKRSGEIAKFGAVVAAGILDAGGRNMCVALTSRTGFLRRGAVVGMVVWLNHWFWHPLLNFFSLALTPTAIIGVNKDMKIPEKFALTCNTQPSLFAYPKPLEEKKEEVMERVTTVVLSTTLKAKAKAKLKQASTEGGVEENKEDKEDKEDNDVTMKTEDDTTPEVAAAAEGAAAAAEGAAAEKKKEEVVVEPTSFAMANPSRVTYAQYEYVTPDANNRYRPIIPNKRNLGVVVLTDSTPDVEDDSLMEIEAPPKAGEEAEEPECPAPFDWIAPEHKK